jgi:hypothetical protein
MIVMIRRNLYAPALNVEPGLAGSRSAAGSL